MKQTTDDKVFMCFSVFQIGFREPLKKRLV